MVDIMGIYKSWRDETGAICAKVDIQVSTADELPELGGEVGGMKIQAGTSAQIIKAGKFGTIDEDGTWYESGTGDDLKAAATALTARMSAQSVTMDRSAMLGGGKSVLFAEDEPDSTDELDIMPNEVSDLPEVSELNSDTVIAEKGGVVNERITL